MFWNVVVKVINITMVFGVPPMVLFAVLVSAGVPRCAQSWLWWPVIACLHSRTRHCLQQLTSAASSTLRLPCRCPTS